MAPFRQQLFVMGYVGILLAALVALYVRPKINDLPAWVQALGSIAAIFVAIWTAQWQAGRARRDRIEARREFRKAVAGLSTGLADLIEAHASSLIEDTSHHVHEGANYRDFRLLDAALDRFDPSALISADGVLALEALRSEAGAAERWESVVVNEYVGAEYYDFDVDEAVRRWSKRAYAHAQVLEMLAQQDR